jgi:NADPH-dependent curcumin reductase CurA
MHGLLVSLLVLSMAVLVPGCSLFTGDRQAVRITASDPQAKIMVDGAAVGTGTAAVELKRNRSHTVIAQAGSRQGAATINKRISTTGVLDLVGGCIFLVPFLGVLGAGFWQLEPEDVAVIIPQ